MKRNSFIGSYLLGIFLILSSCVVEKLERFSHNYSPQADRSIMRIYFPNQKNNFFSVSGDSPLLDHRCPVVFSSSKYIFIDFVFTDTAFKEEDLALYNVFIEKKELQKDGEVKWKAVADNYYYAGNYIYSVRMKNIYPPGEYRLYYGFYLKSDSLNPYPRLHKRECHFEIHE